MPTLKQNYKFTNSSFIFLKSFYTRWFACSVDSQIYGVLFTFKEKIRVNFKTIGNIFDEVILDQMHTKIELSTMCFPHGDTLARIKRCKDYIESQGFEFGIQLHNSVTKDLYNKIRELDVEFSFHAPVFSDYFINLANNDFNTVLAGFQNTASVMQSLQVTSHYSTVFYDSKTH